MSQVSIQLLPFSSQRAASNRVWIGRAGMLLGLCVVVSIGILSVMQMQIVQANSQIEQLEASAAPTLQLQSQIDQLDQQIAQVDQEYQEQQKLCGPPMNLHILSLITSTQQVVGSRLMIQSMQITPETLNTQTVSNTKAVSNPSPTTTSARLRLDAKAKDDHAIETFIKQLKAHPAITTAKMTKIEHSPQQGELFRLTQIEATYQISLNSH